MKKTISLLLIACLALSLCACAGLNELYPRPIPELTPVPDPVASTPTPEPEATPRPDLSALLGAQVLVNISNTTDSYAAPDDSDQIILTFGYDSAHVQIPNNAEAAEKINQLLSLTDETYYSGTGNGDGLNSLLEQATDNYSYARETGEDVNLEYSCVRSLSVSRADSHVISLVYQTYRYTGGMHGIDFDTAYVFSAETGERLSLEQLSSDDAGFSDFLVSYMMKTVDEDVRYTPVRAYTEQIANTELETALTALLREGSWYFSENGMVIFSSVYEIASYADGIVRFTIPYGELTPWIDAAYLPVERVGEGMLDAALLEDLPEGSVELIDRVTIREGAQNVILYTSGTIYDLTLSTVSFVDGAQGFYRTAEHWYASYLDNSGVQIETIIPEGIPDLMLSFHDSKGEMHRLLLSQSGQDGRVMLIDAGSVEAVG